MENGTDVVRKKKKVSKKNKKSWIKHIDNEDVENFLDEQRQQERLGTFSEKKDEELFVIDDIGQPKKKLTKREKAKLPPKSITAYENTCPIPDPVGQRTRVRTKEERKCRIRKSIEEARARNGIIPAKVAQARKDRERTLQDKRAVPKEIVFNKDIWSDESKGVFKDGDVGWLKDETIRHHTGTRKIKKPSELTQKKSVIPAVEKPHPGISYNPTFKDHQDLLKEVAEKEIKKEKEEKHIARCTSQIFKKITIQQKEARWVEEMSGGLHKEEDDDVVHDGPISVNPPTSFMNRKTLKQRRKMKEQKQLALARKYAKIEKRKIADIHKLRFILKDIENKQKKEEIQNQIRKKKEELNIVKTKRLGMRKFIEPDPDFSRKCELRGNLRNVQKTGSLLADRFYSLQKRNILEPTSRVTRFKKKKVKKFTKKSHQVEGVHYISSIKPKGRKTGPV